MNLKDAEKLAELVKLRTDIMGWLDLGAGTSEDKEKNEKYTKVIVSPTLGIGVEGSRQCYVGHLIMSRIHFNRMLWLLKEDAELELVKLGVEEFKKHGDTPEVGEEGDTKKS